MKKLTRVVLLSLLAGCVSAGVTLAQHNRNHDGMKHSFDDVERWTSIFDAEGRDEWQKPAEVVQLMEISPGMTVADIGAGTGYFLEHLAKAVGPRGHVIGLDIEPKMVAFMNERANSNGWSQVEAREIAPDDARLAASSVDRILVVNTWHHIEGREAYAEKLLPALRRGGQLLIVDFTMDAPMGPPAEKRLTFDTVIGELQAAGFKAKVLEETLPHQYVVSARVR